MCKEHNVKLDQYSWFDAIGRCVEHFSTIKDKAAASATTDKAKTE
jgi:hypothetical protein